MFIFCGFVIAIIAKVTNLTYGEGIPGITAKQFYDVEVSYVYKGVSFFFIQLIHKLTCFIILMGFTQSICSTIFFFVDVKKCFGFLCIGGICNSWPYVTCTINLKPQSGVHCSRTWIYGWWSVGCLAIKARESWDFSMTFSCRKREKWLWDLPQPPLFSCEL